MSELLGVVGSGYRSEAFKHELLMFDRIAYVGLAGTIEGHHRAGLPGSDSFADDLEWLADRGVVIDCDSILGASASHYDAGALERATALTKLAQERVELAEESLARERLELDEGHRTDVASPAPEVLRDVLETIHRDVPAWLARVVTPQLLSIGINAVPVCTPRALDIAPPDAARRNEVIRLVINSLPTPSATAPLEDVLAFREETRLSRLALRVWINDMGAGKLSGHELDDKLEYLLNEYEEGARRLRAKKDATILETLIFPAKGVVEYVTTLGSKLFAARKQQLDLMEAETKLPGREVAYIVKAREKFGG